MNISAQHLDRLVYNRWFGCLTRNAFEIQLEQIDWRGKAIVYFDIDNLKLANDSWGKEESSRKIAESIAFRRTDIGQWFSGDEFAAVVSLDDAVGFAKRIQKELTARDMSATFLIATGIRDVDHAERVLSKMKTNVGKARIYIG